MILPTVFQHEFCRLVRFIDAWHFNKVRWPISIDVKVNGFFLPNAINWHSFLHIYRWYFQQLIVGLDYIHRMVSFPFPVRPLASCAEHNFSLQTSFLIILGFGRYVNIGDLHPERYSNFRPLGFYICDVKGIVHRDVKLENMLIDKSPKPILKLCDFGFSKHIHFQSKPGSRVGTAAYLAPEIIMSSVGNTYDGQVPVK